MNTRIHRQRGAAAVEFALALPLFLALVWGLLSFGALFYTQIAVSRAAHDAARALVLVPPQGTDLTATARDVAVRSLAATPLAPPAHNGSRASREAWLNERVRNRISVSSAACEGRQCYTVRVDFPYDNEVRLLPSLRLPLVGQLDVLPPQLVASAVITR